MLTSAGARLAICFGAFGSMCCFMWRQAAPCIAQGRVFGNSDTSSWTGNSWEEIRCRKQELWREEASFLGVTRGHTGSIKLLCLPDSVMLT